MFVLDTNVGSGMMHLGRVPEVAAWMARQDEDHLFTTAISHAEIFSGLAIMLDGRRHRDLERTARAMFAEFGGRVLALDEDAATVYSKLFALCRQAGRPTGKLDLMIASITRSQDANIVTRDMGGFEGCNITLINPWEAS